MAQALQMGAVGHGNLIFIHTHTHTHKYTYMHMHVCVCIHTHTHTHRETHIYVHTYYIQYYIVPCDPCRGSSPSAGIYSWFWVFLLCTFCCNTSALAWGAGLVCVHVLFGFDIMLLNANAFAGICGVWYTCICSYTCSCAIFLVRDLSASIRALCFGVLFGKGKHVLSACNGILLVLVFFFLEVVSS